MYNTYVCTLLESKIFVVDLTRKFINIKQCIIKKYIVNYLIIDLYYKHRYLDCLTKYKYVFKRVFYGAAMNTKSSLKRGLSIIISMTKHPCSILDSELFFDRSVRCLLVRAYLLCD